MTERSIFDSNQTGNWRVATSEQTRKTTGQFSELAFQPASGPDVFARSAEDLVAARISVSPDFIATAWSPDEAQKYRELQRAERQNGGETVK